MAIIFFIPRGSIAPVVFTTTVILTGILIAALLKKRWSYTAGFIFGIILLGMILSMPIRGFNPGVGPYFVTPICIMMIVFSYLTKKQAYLLTPRTADEVS